MLMLIFIVLILPLTVLSQDDPCKNYTMLYDDGGRSINCDRYYSESHDRFIDEGWRRVQLQPTGEDLTMPTQCVPNGYCGSHSNVWLNGAHPAVEDGIVNRTGCLSMYSSCCKEQYPIRIKNCTDYMVYDLMRLRPTDTRYCFGDSAHCSPSTVSSTPRPTTVSSTTTTPRPTTVSSTTTTPRPTTVSSTTTTPRPTTVSSTTTTPRPTTVSVTTEMLRPTTVYATSKTPRPATVSSTTETIRSNTLYPTTEKYERITTVRDEMKPSSVNDNQRDIQKTDNVPDEYDVVSNIQYFQTDKLVLILGVCLSMTMALLITLVVGIFFILKQSIVRPKPTNV